MIQGYERSERVADRRGVGVGEIYSAQGRDILRNSTEAKFR